MEKRSSVLKKPINASNFTLSLIIFFVSIFLLSAALYTLRQVKAGMERQELRLLAISTANKITKVITDRIWKAETLATLIVQGNGEMDDFEKIAAILVNDPAVLNVSLAPNGVVSKIFPYEKNESVIGLDYLKSGGATETQSAKESGKLTLAGPFELVQGGQAVTGRLPVYLPDGSFWGIIGIALAYPGVLDAAFLDELFEQGFSGEIWRIDPADQKKQIIWQSQKQPKAGTIAIGESREIPLFNVVWHVSVARLTDMYGHVVKWLQLAGVLFFSLLAATLCYHYLELRHMKVVLENMAMTDTLTSLPNRRNIMQRLEAAARGSSPFVVLYMDLNCFKQVNDTRGHDVGDLVLVKAAGILREHIGKKGFVARVGGDEFIVFLRNYTRSQKLDRLITELDNAICIPIPAMGDKEPFDVTASFGVSYFPEDGKDLKTLLHAADLRMYNTKKIKRDTVVFKGFKHHFR